MALNSSSHLNIPVLLLGEYNDELAKEYYENLEVGHSFDHKMISHFSTQEVIKNEDGSVEIHSLVNGWWTATLDETQFKALLTGELSYHDLNWE